MDLISKWVNHDMSIRGRDNLASSDKMWSTAFINLQNKKDDLEFQPYIVKPNTLLYRVHIGGNDEPDYDLYDDRGEYQNVEFAYKYNEWLDENNVKAIRFHNHWVSFTKCVDVIGSNYFGEKGRRGFVIVISSDKAVDISSESPVKAEEQEVVAPMDKKTVVEILPFKDFMEKYGTGNSEYEKREAEII